MMMITPKFVKEMPEKLDDGIIYISMEYATAIHKCACGCGNQVVTPFSPTDWKLYFDGETVSIDPSIGNWSFPCQSHYWIRKNQIEWAPKWTKEQIKKGRERERYDKETQNRKSFLSFFFKKKTS